MTQETGGFAAFNLNPNILAAVIATGYEHEGETSSSIGVLGPVRMDYASNIAAVRAVARYLSGAIGES